MWGLLLAWQVFLGFGLVVLYFLNCCFWTLWIGLACILIGLGLMIWWAIACRRSFCQVVAELAPVVSAVIALIAYAAISPLSPCLNAVVGTIVGSVSAILVFILAGCFTTTGSPAA